MDNDSVKRNILKLREKLNLSQQDFADKIGISRNAYRSIEKGTTRIISDKLGQIADSCEVSKEELLLGYVPMEKDCRLSDIVSDYEGRLETARKEIQSTKELISSFTKTIRVQEEMISMLKRKLEENNV